MRRFIASLPGRVLGQLVIMALLMPFVTLASLRTAVAQVAVLPTWGVVEFKNNKSAGTQFGKTAAEAVSGELAKTGQYDVLPQATVARAIETLGIASPPDGQTNLLRVASEVRASTVVSGVIHDYKVVSSAAGKQAVAVIAITVTDVASGVAINGAVAKGESTVRPGDVADETLINDAIVQGASTGIREIQSRQLPTGTVLNTLPNAALINRGQRSGFTVGQQVIVLRGREQVATATVTDVEPDSATVQVGRLIKGIQPGDKVRAIFTPPTPRGGITGPNNDIKIVKPRTKSNNAGIITALIVIGLVVALVGGPGGSGNDVVSEVNAEATLYPDVSGVPAIRVSWSPNGFAGGRSNRTAWQIWRDDVIDTPVLVVSGAQTNAIDTQAARNVSWLDAGGIVGGQTCRFTAPTGANDEGVAGLVTGRPYTYGVELVYGLSILDLPDGGNTGSGSGGSGGIGGTGGTANTGTGTGTGTGTNGTVAGTNGGTNTGSTTGTGTNTGGNGGNAATCYFVSARRTARGLATAIPAPSLVAPQDRIDVNRPVKFTFNSVRQANPITVEYIVQLSATPTFAANQTVTVARFVSNGAGVEGTPTDIDTTKVNNAAVRDASTVYWRAGARNVADRPGPVPDAATKERYVFSQWRFFKRAGGPPPPP